MTPERPVPYRIVVRHVALLSYRLDAAGLLPFVVVLFDGLEQQTNSE